MSLNMLGMSMGYGECVQQVGRKIRKPYTISKCRESWTEQEHDKFCEALQLFDRDWKKIEAFVGSKTIIQIRSHAQKYFLKVQKNGTGEHVPPPRPKRKSSQPYPQKAPKFALFGQQVQRGGATAFCCDSLFSFRPQSSTLSTPAVSSPSVSSWVHHTVPQSTVSSVSNGVCVSDFKSEREISGRDDNSDSGRSSWSGFLQQSNPAVQGNHEMFRVMPDFAEVYNFIGSVFDPNASGHLKKLKGMTPIDRETILLLMRNLSANLTSPDLLEHLTFLSLHDTCSKDPRPSVKNINAGINIPCVVPQPLSA